MKGNYSESRAVGTVAPVAQKTKFEKACAKFNLNNAEKGALALLLAMPAFAHADAGAGGANFSLDISSIISGISTLVGIVTSIGLAFLSVMLVIKAFKYIKSAM